MKWTCLAAIALAGAGASPGQAEIYYRWAIGQEREVDEGVYARLIYQQSGWRVWRFERIDQTDCIAIKSAMARPHPVPIGVGIKFYGGTPYVMAHYWSTAQSSWSIEGAQFRPRAKFRKIGDRFWVDYQGMALDQFDGENLEVQVTSWEYPELYVGMEDESAVIDMTGTSAAVEKALACIRDEKTTP